MGHPQVQKMAQFPAPREAPGHTEALTVLGAAADDALHAHGAPVHVLVVALRGHEGGEGEGRPEGAERVGWAEDTSPRAAPPPGRARGQQGSPGFALRRAEGGPSGCSPLLSVAAKGQHKAGEGWTPSLPERDAGSQELASHLDPNLGLWGPSW